MSKSSSFFDRREILDIVSYARVMVDSSDDASLRRIYNTPNRFLSKQLMEELERFAGSRNISLLEAFRITPLAKEWKNKGINTVVRTIEDMHYQMNISADKFLRNVVKATGYMQHVELSASNANLLNEAKESIERLYNMSARFSNIKDFLNYVSVMSEKKKKSKHKDAVNIVTIHSSKGLEWDIVFVPNVHHQSLPHKMNLDVEEERRLFYVATSRPRKKLFVSWSVFDVEGIKNGTSMFVNELLGSKVNNMNDQASCGLEEYCLIGD
jgi:DNA helicase-2/ATP-dependent DNA helicase PcrA